MAETDDRDRTEQLVEELWQLIQDSKRLVEETKRLAFESDAFRKRLFKATQFEDNPHSR